MGGGGERGQHRFMSALRLKGHSGPVTAVDVWERPEEVKPPGWFSRKKRGGEGGDADADAARRSLPCASSYVVVTGGTDGTVRVWAARWNVDKRGRSKGSALHLATQTGLHNSGSIVEHISLSVDGRLAASVGRDGRVGVTDVATGKTWSIMQPSTTRGLFGRSAPAAPVDPIATLSGLPLYTCSVDVTRRPVTVTSAGADGTVRVWDLRSGSVAVAFPSGSPVWCYGTVPAHGCGAPTFAADGSVLAPGAPLGDAFLVSGHEDGVVRKWDSRRSIMPLESWSGHAAAVTSMATDGDKVVTGSTDGVVRLWDAKTGLSVRCPGHAGQVSAAALCDDYALTAAWDGSLRLWFAGAL
jgi:WD40 repeat protein